MSLAVSQPSKGKRVACLALVLATFLLLWASRCLTLGHELALHPDEHVFYLSASSVFYGEEGFQPEKDYPGGAFVFQMPFQWLGKVVSGGEANWVQDDPVLILWGRIASIFYFSLGFLLGAALLWKRFGQRVEAVFFYCLSMLLGLFQMEQSRYGTGDPISFFLLMLILFLLDRFFSKKATWALHLSVFCTGALAAIKFPLAFFLALPLCALWLVARKGGKGTGYGLRNTLASLPIFAVGVLAFSPQIWNDPAFLGRTFTTELNIYVLEGNKDVTAGPLHHLLSLLIYHLFYADFPLATPIAAFGVVGLVKARRASSQEDPGAAFFAATLPVLLVIFFAYNLVSKTLFMRTYYPFFCLCLLYTAYGLARLVSLPRMKWAVGALALVMAVRGGYFLYALSSPSQADHILQQLTTHPKWEERTMTVVFDEHYLTGQRDIPGRKYLYQNTGRNFEDGAPVLQPGNFAVTDPMDYGFAQRRLFYEPGLEVESTLVNWAAFKAEHQAYFIGQAYPPHYYPLFGSWVLGTTTGLYEFPANYLYYIPMEDATYAFKTKEYRPLYEATGLEEYLDLLSSMDRTLLILSPLGAGSTDTLDLIAQVLEWEEDPYDFYESDLIVIQPGHGVVYQETLEDSETVRLLPAIGVDCDVRKKDWHNIFTAQGRTYNFYEDGYSFLLYDMDLECVMDWNTIIEDENWEYVLSHGRN